MPEQELRECPFCGEPAALFQTRYKWSAVCSNPQCTAEISGFYHTDNAVSAWNRRNPPESPDDSALRLGRAVMTYLASQTPASLREWGGLLHRQSGDRLPLHWMAGLFETIADNYPGKPEGEEEEK